MSIPPVTAVGAASPSALVGDGADTRTPEDVAKAAEGFERLLVARLAETLLDNAMPDDAAGASAAYRDMLPDALTEALMSGGGIGLAKTLEEGLA
jgi:Rod binding domain-containing protein